MPTYYFTVRLDDPDTIVTGTIQLATRGHDDELFMGDWQLDSVAPIGEPVLAIELGDGDALLAWEAVHYDAVSEAIDAWVDKIDWATVAIDEAALAGDRAVDEAAEREIDEWQLSRGDRVLH